jgi:pimeloyl-ACP methyl ester carboxylesterase
MRGSLDEAMSRYIEPEFNKDREVALKAAGIAHERAGAGEPLLLLHGTGGSRRHWAPVQSTLVGHHELIAVDLPGHGDSDPPPDGDHTPLGYAAVLARFLDQLGIDAAHIAGDSVGGWTALEMAKLGRARSVVAIAPAGLWARHDPWRCSLRLCGMYRLGRLMAPLTERALRSEAGRTRLLRGTVAKPLNLSPHEARDLIETYNRTATFTKHLAQTRRARFRNGTSIRVPVTVAWGDDERLIPAKARRQHELPPHTKTVTLYGCGHVPFWDDPEQVAHAILETTSRGGINSGYAA